MYCFWKISTAITLYRHLTLTLFNISQPQPNITDIISLIVFFINNLESTHSNIKELSLSPRDSRLWTKFKHIDFYTNVKEFKEIILENERYWKNWYLWLVIIIIRYSITLNIRNNFYKLYIVLGRYLHPCLNYTPSTSTSDNQIYGRLHWQKKRF